MQGRFLIAAALAGALGLSAPLAHADQSIIKLAGAHPSYVFEAEPHALVAPFDDFRPGVGFRGSLVVVDKTRPAPALYVGGRFHFTDRITLTLRVGHPTASVGVSFLL